MKQVGYLAFIAAMASLAASLPAGTNSTVLSTGNGNHTSIKAGNHTSTKVGKLGQPDGDGFTVPFNNHPEDDGDNSATGAPGATDDIPSAAASQDMEPTKTALAPASSSRVG